MPNNLDNWATDAAIDWVPQGDFGQAHGGIVEALERIWNNLKLWLAKDSGLPLAITGHSLGGALAVIAATRVHHLHPAVYTFGQPRVGNKAFSINASALFTKSYFRFVHERDFGAHYLIQNNAPQLISTHAEDLNDALGSILLMKTSIPPALLNYAAPLLERLEQAAFPVLRNSAIIAIKGLKLSFEVFPSAAAGPWLDAVDRYLAALPLDNSQPTISNPASDHSPIHYTNAFPPL
jgi:hypothetical protein